MMISLSLRLHLWRGILAVLLLGVQCFGLNRDGILLLSFKYSVLEDPLCVLQNWNYNDVHPCSWNGVVCQDQRSVNSSSPVTGISLPNSQLVGSIPADLGLIGTLQNLNLANNSFNGSLPESLFNATTLRVFDLSNNLISGELPESISQLSTLQSLNLSDNSLVGKVPTNLTALSNLTVVSFKNNYFSGNLPVGFRSVEVLDLSSNLLTGSLPPDFGGERLIYLNISYNKLSGRIPPEFAETISQNASVDLSFNNFTGEIPQIPVFLNQELTSFAGNPYLCGEPTKNLCPIISSPASSSNVSSLTSPPAIAAIPKSLNPNPDTPSSQTHTQKRLTTATIIAIVVGDVVGFCFLFLIFLYVYQLKKKKNRVETVMKNDGTIVKETWSSEPRRFSRWVCLRKKGNEEEVSESLSSESEEEDCKNGETETNQGLKLDHEQQSKKGTLVTVDGEKELELETLLKASAYILGATGSSIMYKAVLEDGSALAVRRIGESSVDRLKEFENQVRTVAKLVHPNLVRIRGFYWGVDEKLIIYDFVPNGSLANARYRKVGSSPCHLPWDARLKIARGVARGLCYLHDKKHVHGNLKPNNILLGNDNEPKIGDFGIDKLLFGETSCKGGSTRNFGSNRSSASRDSFQDFVGGPSPGPSPSSISSSYVYHAPESLRSLKPSPKWDVYSFGVILLELLTGKVIVLDEMGQVLGLTVEDKNRALRIADVAIRADLEGKEEALLALFKLGYSCASLSPQKRPSMKEVVQVLEKFPSPSSSSSPSSSYLYGH